MTTTTDSPENGNLMSTVSKDPSTGTGTPDRVRDEADIRELYSALLGSWGDAEAYVDHFTPDADYIVSSGVVERGREEMVAGHRLIFTTWAHGTRLAGAIDSVRFLTSDVAFVVAHGTLLLPGQEEIDPRELTVYSLVAVRAGTAWRFAGYQNTPVQDHAA